jgi:hypothetical protein
MVIFPVADAEIQVPMPLFLQKKEAIKVVLSKKRKVFDLL